MNLNKIFIGLAAAVSINVLAAQPAPVIDVSSQAVGDVDQVTALKRQLDARNRAQVNIQRQLDELQTEVNELRGAIELHSHQLSQVFERQRELYQELDRRVTEALKSTTQSIPSTIAAPEGATAGNAQSYSGDLSENESYDRAVNLVLKQKQYDKAIPEFRAFNKKFPNSSYAANAHYWLGQLLFNKGSFAEAETEFTIVVNQHKDSSKRPDAILKLGMVAQKQKQNGKAISFYQQLINEYGSSTAAQLAKSRLASLQQ